ncbi:iron-siderophore ABC transporter substrate-binding protein [Nostoc sp.]|uniref:iron-siderophore ABC transporter substrate-binding protein n=1 Tax=Nostoc sp. TaxID=1180 RepID=UPI002FFAD018
MSISFRRLTHLILLSILTVILVSACNTTNNTSMTHYKQPVENCRTVQHAMGEICVPNYPERLVAISHFTLADALVLGVQPIGSASASNDLQNKFPAYLKNETQGIKQLGSQYEPNLERIAFLKPDLILGWEEIRKIYPLLSQISPTAIIPWQGTSSWKEHFKFLAEVLRKEEEYKQAWNSYFQRIEKLKTALNNQYKDKKISVVSVVGGYGIISWVKSSFIGSILDDVGLQRPKSQNVILTDGDRIFNISEERLEEIDGDILFITIGRDSDRKALEKLQQKSLWRKLRAIQQGQVHFVDTETWSGSNLLAADAVIDDLYKYLVNAP